MTGSPEPHQTSGVIAVVGASLPGLAAAGRLARAGHEVMLLDRLPAAPALLPSPIDPDPHAVVLPAAWRDLFKKTGRTLDAELGRHGLALVPAPARRHETPGGILDLPHDRAGQWHVLSDSFGSAAAIAWRDLLDRADTAWLTLRRLGIEAEFTGLARADRRALRASESLADLAAGLPPDLSAIVTGLARQRDSDPRQTPGWQATRLSIERTFGVWQLIDEAGATRPAQLLVELLLERLGQRGVELRWGCEVHSVRGGMLATDAGVVQAQAVVLAMDPWSAAALAGPDRNLARSTRRITRAASAGPRWQGWRTLLALPRLTTNSPGSYVASAFSPAGPEPWAQLLTGALATYRVHLDLTGEDARPTNKQYRPPPLNRKPARES